jgi:hypothetical protein
MKILEEKLTQEELDTLEDMLNLQHPCLPGDINEQTDEIYSFITQCATKHGLPPRFPGEYGCDLSTGNFTIEDFHGNAL